MRLFIAEKPELANAIANGLDKEIVRKNGYIELGDDLVSWTVGHILELAEPHKYNEKYSTWKLEDLPFDIDINTLKYIPKESFQNQLEILVNLINSNKVSSIVHAGDNDEEGQVLVDEILHFASN